MARLKRYAHSLVSGYLLMAANILYTLCSVPLALRFLSEAEFGLWALATQIGVYVALVDFGMASATARIFVDYKDQREGFAGIVQTAVLVNVVQAVIVLLAGAMVAVVVGPLLKVPYDLQGPLKLLVFGQCAILAANFATRIFGQALVAYQRADIANYAQAGCFIASYAVLWLCFYLRFGVYSILGAQAASLFITTCVYALACVKLRLLPRWRVWGSPDWQKFSELFAFGKDMFFFGLGTHLVNASQIVVISRTLGLEAAAVWSICTRTFILIGQLVGRVLDFAAMPLSEMLVRGEHELFLRRYRSITVLSTSMAIAAAVLFVTCNQPFVSLWAGRQFTWWIGNDILLGIWFVLLTLQRCHVGLLGVTKQLQTVKYVYLAEGLTFIVLSLLVVRWGGFSAVIGCSIACTICFTLVYGLRHTQRTFGLGLSQWMHDWFAPNLRLMAFAVPIAAGTWIATEGLNDLSKLVLRSSVLLAATAFASWRLGLNQELQSEILEKSPRLVRPALALGLKPLRRQA
jgi:O-antigen/teichoic acid export membrane protein